MDRLIICSASKIVQGVPKKTHDSGFLAITLLWKGLGRKVGCVLKNSGNSLSDRHQNFSIWPIRSWEIWVQSWQPFLKNSWKKGWNFAVLLQLFPLLPLHLLTFHYPLLWQGFHLIFKIWILLSNINLNTSGTGCSKYQFLKKIPISPFFQLFLGGLPSLDPIFSASNRSNWKNFVSIR